MGGAIKLAEQVQALLPCLPIARAVAVAVEDAQLQAGDWVSCRQAGALQEQS